MSKKKPRKRIKIKGKYMQDNVLPRRERKERLWVNGNLRKRRNSRIGVYSFLAIVLLYLIVYVKHA